MPVTLKMIAQLTGVSIGTVSRALHNKDRIDPEVASRIRAIADNLGYKPNTVAKSLAIRNKKLKIGVVIIKNDYFDIIRTGIEKAQKEIEDFGVSVIIRSSEMLDHEKQITLLDELLQKNINALVISPVIHSEVAKKINLIYQKGIKVVFLTRTCENASFTAFVGCNYSRMGKISAGLINLLQMNQPGTISLFTPNLLIKEHRDRVECFKKAIKNYYPNLKINTICELTNDDIDCYKTTLSVLINHQDTDIVLYTNGVVNGGYKAIREIAQTRPLKIIGYDLFDTVKEGLLDNTILATISQLPEEQGYKAIMLLFNYLARDEKITKKYYYIEPQIIIKENLL